MIVVFPCEGGSALSGGSMLRRAVVSPRFHEVNEPILKEKVEAIMSSGC